MSFFSDFTYEGSRSIICQYLGLLGAGTAPLAFLGGFWARVVDAFAVLPEFAAIPLILIVHRATGSAARVDRPDPGPRSEP